MGRVDYKQTEDDNNLLSAISQDISAFSGEPFEAAYALKVTWSNVSSLNDSEMVCSRIILSNQIITKRKA